MVSCEEQLRNGSYTIKTLVDLRCLFVVNIFDEMEALASTTTLKMVPAPVLSIDTSTDVYPNVSINHSEHVNINILHTYVCKITSKLCILLMTILTEPPPKTKQQTTMQVSRSKFHAQIYNRYSTGSQQPLSDMNHQQTPQSTMFSIHLVTGQ